MMMMMAMMMMVTIVLMTMMMLMMMLTRQWYDPRGDGRCHHRIIYPPQRNMSIINRWYITLHSALKHCKSTMTRANSKEDLFKIQIQRIRYQKLSVLKYSCILHMLSLMHHGLCWGTNEYSGSVLSLIFSSVFQKLFWLLFWFYSGLFVISTQELWS